MIVIQEKEVLGERLEAASAVVDQLVNEYQKNKLVSRNVRHCRENPKLGIIGEGDGTCRAWSGSDQGMVALLSLHSGPIHNIILSCRFTQPVAYSAVCNPSNLF